MSKKDPENKVQYMPIGMCLGLSIGMAIGAAMDNIPIGMCFGLGIGICFGSAMDNAKHAREEEPEEQEQEEILRAIIEHRNKNVAKERSLAGIIYRADKLSRPCFACAAEKQCDWKKSKKNMEIIY